MTDTAAHTIAELLASITPDQEKALYLLALAESARGEGVEAVTDFGELVFGVVAAKHHRLWLSEMLAGRRTVVTAPPESAKTTWGNIIKNAWKIGQRPELSYGIGSAGDDAADDMTKAIADTIEFNPRWKLVFPHVVPDKQRGWSSNGYHVRRMDLPDGEWERLRYGDKNPTLVGGGVGSARWNGLRLTGGLTLDDAHDRRSKTQAKTNDDTIGFFKDTAEFRVTEQATLDILQTRWNPKDIVALAKTRPDFKVFEHPAIQVVDGVETSYWPEYHSIEKLQAIRARSPIDFELVFQGNDKAIEGTTLKAEWLFYFPMVAIKQEWNRYFGIDPARRIKELLKKGDDPDSLRLTVLVDAGAKLIIEDVFGGVLFGPDGEDLFFSKATIFRPRVTAIEKNGIIGAEYIQNLRVRAAGLGLNYVIQEVQTMNDMGFRMSEISPYFRSGQIMVSDALSAGLETFRSEWVRFPRGHDDTLSATHLAWQVSKHLVPAPNTAYRAKRVQANPFAAFGTMKV